MLSNSFLQLLNKRLFSLPILLTFMIISIIVYLRYGAELEIILNECDVKKLLEQNEREQVDKNGEINSNLITKYLCIKPVKEKIASCLLKELGAENGSATRSVWDHLPYATKFCSTILRRNLDVKELKNKDDEKYAILPSGGSGDQSCRVVTIGIGSDTASEQKLKQLNPRCAFFGADPVLEAGAPYKKLGAYLRMAVSGSGGLQTASVLKNGRYLNETVSSVAFLHLMFNLTRWATVDYLFLDAEGAEYGLVQKWLRGVLKPPSAICQISVELHGLAPHVTADHFNSLIVDLLRNSAYLPVIGQLYGNFMRMFLVDFESEYCVHKYYDDFCVRSADAILVKLADG